MMSTVSIYFHLIHRRALWALFGKEEDEKLWDRLPSGSLPLIQNT